MRDRFACARAFMAARAYSALIFCFLSASGLPDSFAQEVSTADALFRSAHTAADEGHWELACERFAESHRLDPSAGALLNLARCSEKLGRWTTAYNYYVEVFESLGTTDERGQYAQQKANELELVLPRLVLRVPAAFPEGVKVQVQGMRLSSASFGVALPFDPGAVEVIVSAPDHEDFRVEALVVKSETVEMILQLGKKSSSPEKMGTSQEKRSLRSTSAFAVGALGVSVGITGTIWALVELNKVNQGCDEFCNSDGIDATKRGKSAVALMAGGYAVGAIALGLGWRWWRLDQQKSNRVAISHQAIIPVKGGAQYQLGGHF